MNDPVTYTVDSEGIGWITFDDPNAKANVFNPHTVAGFQKVFNALGGETTLKAVVIQSGKENVFIAGADIRLIETIDSAEKALELVREGHKFMAMIASFKVPVIAAIHGACAGGGCEMALACHYRIASDSPKTQIGLPEVQLGIIPGWGGCVRLPRLVGLRIALDYILKGDLKPAGLARKHGLMDEVVPEAILKECARKWAWKLAKDGKPQPPSHLENTWPMRAIICSQARKMTLARTRGNYPSPLKAIDAVEQGLGLSIEQACENEAKRFCEVALTPESKNLIRVFFLREENRKLTVDGWFPGVAASVSERPLADARGYIRRVGVIGAGVMGSGIAHWCSTRGFDVRIRDVKPEFVAKGMQSINKLYQESVQRRKLTAREAQQGMARVTATTDWSGFANCDLIIEAVIEDMKIKKPVFEELSRLVRPDAILATNTSAIPINEIASCATHPERVIGIHFFNPVSRMPLVELILGPQTGRAAAEISLSFVKTLGKQIVICKDSPGFLVNRILLPYLNTAGHLLMEGSDVRTIDDALLDFGMPMGPLRLIDEVGVDVSDHVATELAHYFGERMKVADVLVKMNEAGLKGRKGGAGFYVYEGKKERVNPDLGKYLPGGASRSLPKQAITDRLLGVMIEEAKLCLKEGVVRSADEVDLGMIMGTGFPPFRGGLMRYAQSIGKA